MWPVLCACLTSYVTLGEENGLRVLNKLLRKMFGTKREYVTGGWKKYLNKELN
jgi:hypothetical protein